jgi:DNA-directed RNA polymerase subunit RPC12/RpoP
MDFDMDPATFFIWDELIDPGKEYECPSCGRLLDGGCAVWSDDAQCLVIECPDCHVVTLVE